MGDEKMVDSIRSILTMKGIRVSEDDCAILSERWDSVLALKGELKGAKLADSNIILRFVPEMGRADE